MDHLCLRCTFHLRLACEDHPISMCKRLVRFVPKINTLKPRPGPAPGRRLGECGRHRPQDVTGDGSDEWREDLSDRLEAGNR